MKAKQFVVAPRMHQHNGGNYASPEKNPHLSPEPPT